MFDQNILQYVKKKIQQQGGIPLVAEAKLLMGAGPKNVCIIGRGGILVV